MDIDLEELAAMVELLKTAEFSEFRYEKGDLHIVIRRGDVSPDHDAGVARPPVIPSAPPADRPATSERGAGRSPSRSPVQVTAPVEGADVVTAPLLGTFYARAKPGEAPFVKVGDKVEPDTVLCIVEVMKLMNSVHAGRSGVIAAIHAEDGQLVEFGQALFSIVPGDA
jgi:acetyl-CoA carboxylase biotin carboxyl carrier protein